MTLNLLQPYRAKAKVRARILANMRGKRNLNCVNRDNSVALRVIAYIAIGSMVSSAFVLILAR